MNATLLPQEQQQESNIIAMDEYLFHGISSAAAIFGIPANIAVLLSILYFRDMRTISNVYILNLAIADLIFLCGTPVILYQATQLNWEFGSLLCTVFFSVSGIAQFSSSAFIAILSFDRFLAVCRPLASSSWRSINTAVLLSALTWCMIILEMTPLLIFSKVVKFVEENEVTHKCMLSFGKAEFDLMTASPEEMDAYMANFQRPGKFFITYCFMLSYLLPLIGIWYFYSRIIHQMWHRRQNLFVKRESTKRRTTKVTFLGLAIAISYTACWLPFWFVQYSIVTESDWIENSKLRKIMSHYAYALQYVCSAANPIIYVFLSDAFRRNIMRCLPSKRTTGGKLPPKRCLSCSDTTKMLTVPLNGGGSNINLLMPNNPRKFSG